MKVLVVAILFSLSVFGMEQKIDEDTIPNLIAKNLLANIYDKAVENLKECVVCYDERFPVSFQFSCGHEMCAVCAESTMKKCVNSNCPMCRKALPKVATEWLTLIKIYPINLTRNISLENLQHIFPLICCVGDLTTVTKCVTEMGVNVNTKGSLGYFPIHLASQTNVVKYLLDKKADVNQVDHRGVTPLFMSCYRGHLRVVEYLINKGANMNQATNNGWRPLTIAINNNHTEIVQILLEKKRQSLKF
jgi:hypothetical protein